MDAALFKEAMRRLAASVCLITTTGPDGERSGLTATAVCSLSADPPSLLCCLNRSSNSFAAISQSRIFCVNVLPVSDAGVAHRFAGDRPGSEKFQAGGWRTGATGAPMLTTALAAFDCALTEVVEAGTHGILIGRVVEIALAQTDSPPLLYARGGYGAFSAADADAALDAG